MIITVTLLALLVKIAGLYLLLQHAAGKAVKPANQRGHQVYYNAFARPARRADDQRLTA